MIFAFTATVTARGLHSDAPLAGEQRTRAGGESGDREIVTVRAERHPGRLQHDIHSLLGHNFAARQKEPPWLGENECDDLRESEGHFDSSASSRGIEECNSVAERTEGANAD